MAVRKAQAVWTGGDLKTGNGNIRLGSGAYDGQYNFSSRFEEGVGTNPEELLGAAHAGCYTMKLNAMLHIAGYAPSKVDTTAHVTLEKVDDVMMISKIKLVVEASVPDIDDAKFQQMAQEAHDGCIVSIALASIPEITVEAALV